MTPRELADACCDECRALPGDGPWCPRCGREWPDGEVDDAWCSPHITKYVCPTCESEIA